MQKEGVYMSPRSLRTLRLLALWFFLLYAAFTLVPGAVYGLYRSREAAKQENFLPASTAQEFSLSSDAPEFLEGAALPEPSPASPEESFTVYDTSTGETLTLTPEEFLPAALACEMDLSAPEEALKAQTVALYTFYTYQKQHSEETEADFACDSEQWLVYVPQSAMEERWGEEFSSLYETLQQVVSSVQGQMLTWEGEPIQAAFCSISGGATQSALAAWGEKIPYLQTVPSPGDCFAQGYLSSVTLTGEELSQLGQEAFDQEVDFSGSQEEWITEMVYGPSGYVETACLGGKTVTGEELREVLGLRSACFQLTYEEGCFHFTVHGWGHGVGMSQAGAIFLANQGESYQEILAHYYPGAVLTTES